MSKDTKALLWGVAAAMLATFGQELAAGNVPLPPEWRWVVPILVAGISMFSPFVRVKKRAP